eukprot:403371660
MKLKTVLSTLLMAITTVIAADTSSNLQPEPSQVQVMDIAKFVEGFLYGVINHEFHNIDQCIADVGRIAQNVEIAVTNFKKENFSGIKAGLLEIGQAVKLIPTAVNDCKQVTQDLSKLVKMAEVFAHPLSLIYHVGKNLILNGVDIFKKIADALIAYGAKDYFSFGMYVGQAMDTIFLHAPYPKNQIDVEAYEFFDNFYAALNGNSQIDQQQLYNNIDGLGLMIYGPIRQSMTEFNNDSNLNMKIWMTLHEISHSLLEGCDSLVAKNAITTENRDEIKTYAACLSKNKPKDIDSKIEGLFQKSYALYNAGQTDQVGKIYGQIAVMKCGQQSLLFLQQ